MCVHSAVKTGNFIQSVRYRNEQLLARPCFRLQGHNLLTSQDLLVSASIERSLSSRRSLLRLTNNGCKRKPSVIKASMEHSVQ